MQINTTKLRSIVESLMYSKKGILAADESNRSANKRFEVLGISQTEENRRRYRQLLFTTPGIERYVSGVILYDETLRQSTDGGQLFRDLLASKHICIGIKVDQGLEPVSPSSVETVTKGLHGLEGRLKEYASLGAVFTKWRAAFRIGKDMPSDVVIRANCQILAEYAQYVQQSGMVPILEPEVLLEGDHSIETAEHVTEKVLKALFVELEKREVFLEGVILKTSMVVAGGSCSRLAETSDVATRTARVLRSVVPASVGGVVFLSGGQSPDYAAENLDAIAKLGPYPWPLTFSFSRALQQPALENWHAKDENKEQSQKLFAKRLALNSWASQGKIEFSEGRIHEHHVTGIRGFFWVMVIFIIVLLIIL